MARFLLSAIITLFALHSHAQSNCEVYYQYTLGLCPNILFFSNVPSDQIENTTFLWQFGDGTTSDEPSPDHTYTASGHYEVCLTIERNGCTSTYCDIIPVPCIQDGNCHAAFDYYSTSACGVYQFYDRSFTTTPNQVYDIQWSFGDGSGDSQNHYPVHTYSANGEYEVCVSIVTADGCADTYCETVVVDCFTDPPVCEAAFQYTLGQCPTVQFSGASTTPPPGTAADWVWDFGDGTTGIGNNPSHTYTSNGTFTVCLVATFPDGCVADHCETLTIACIPECETAFQYTLDNCPAVQFYGATTTPPPANTAWHWDFGDGGSATGPSPVHTYAENGTYTVCLLTTDPTGCTAEYCEEVTINCIPPPCQAFIQYTLGACPEIYFFGNSNTIANPVIWAWDFGDGHTADIQNPVHTYEENGVYTVCLTITSANGCIAEYCTEIAITCLPACEAAFTYSDDHCPVLQFTGATTAPPPPGDPYWVWNFGDGTTGNGPNPEHTYTENGIYIVCLTVYNPFGCQATYCEEIFIDCILPTCEAGFQYTLAHCPEVQFFAAPNIPPNSTVLHWDFGDGTTSPELNPTHTYQANGTYTVCLTATYGNGCVADYCETITINCVPPPCETGFQYTLANCPVVQFFAASTSPPNNTTSYEWHFGDGTTGSGYNPVHEYAQNGTYTVCLIATTADGCVADYCETIVISCIPNCEAFFEFSLNDCPVVAFHSANINPAPGTNAWHWDFGDGSTGVGPNPVHTYEENGFYEVCLTVTHSASCTDTYCETVPIKCIPTGVEEGSEFPVIAYPNPVADLLTLRMDRSGGPIDLALYNAEGQVVGTWHIVDQSDPVISLGHLPGGIYLLRARSGDAEGTIPLIRE